MHVGNKSSELDFTSSSPSYSNSNSNSNVDSPKYPAYYVQSPSRCSQSQDDTSRMQSGQASPTRNTSMSDSPLHSSAYGRSSNPRSSSASRVSGNWRYLRVNKKRANNDKVWESRAIKEHRVYDDADVDDVCGDLMRVALSPYFLAIVGSAMAVVTFCFIMWGASRPYKAQISMQRLKVHNFYVGEGSDLTGVPTKFLTLNCTATMSVHNPATFFGIYVTSSPADLMYLEIRVASGELKRHYQPRTSSRIMTLDLEGSKIPLYGAGAALEDGKRIPLKLNMEIQSCGYLLGGLMKTKQHRHISCSLVFNSERTKDIIFHKHSCRYD